VELTPPIQRSTAGLIISEELVTRLVLSALVLVGLVLRVYNLSPVAWVPDHYERLIEVRAMLDGELPSSAIYAPGFSLVLLFPSALFGASLSTMQGVTIAFSLALIPLVYLLVMQATKDRAAALIAAGLCATSPYLVHSSRFGYLDSVITTLTVLAFFLVPRLNRSSIKAGVGFGALLALLFLLRQSCAILVPVMVLYWMVAAQRGLSPGSGIDALKSRLWLSAGATYLAMLAASVLLGEWYGGEFGSFLEAAESPGNIALFAFFLGGQLASIFAVPLMVAGAMIAFRVNRSFCIGAVVLGAVWLVVHSPFPFIEARYVDPIQPFTLSFAALAIARVIRPQAKVAGRPARLFRVWAMWATIVVLGLSVGLPSLRAARWHVYAERSDYQLEVEMKRALYDLPPESLVVSAVSRAFQDSPPDVRFLDLIDVALTESDRSVGAAHVLDEVEAILEAGDQAYYLFSHLESEPSNTGGIFDNHDVFFATIGRDHRYIQEYRTPSRRDGKHQWVLYRIFGGGD